MSNARAVLNSVNDVVSNLVYYDRKEDEELPVGTIQELVHSGVITKDDIVNRFREQLETWFK